MYQEGIIGGKIMEISIQVGVKVDENNKYDMNVEIPAGALSVENPFVFAVSQKKEGDKSDNVMQIAFSDSNHIFLEVKPPESILQLAGVDQYVDNLKAIVKEGTYDEENKKFIGEAEIIVDTDTE